MKKTTIRRTLVAILVLCMAVCLGVLAACTDTTPPPATATYTVTVKLEDDSPAAGVRVSVKKGGATYDEPKTTNAQGKVEFELPEDDYQITLSASSLPEHYDVPEGTINLTKANPDVTVTLVRKFAYKVKLVGPDGTTPFYQSGVQVGICAIGGSCLEPVDLASNGTAEIEAAKGDYHVQILELPAGYAYEKDENGYYTGENFSATSTEMTIKIYPVTEIKGEPATLNAADVTELQSKGVYGYIAGDKVYKYTGTLEKGEKKYFVLTPEITGKFAFSGSGYASYYLDDAFRVSPEDEEVKNIIMPGNTALTAGKAYYVSIVNATEGAQEYGLIVKAPTSSYVEYAGNGGTLALTVGAQNQNAIVKISATQATAFKVTAQGEALAVIESSPYESEENGYTDEYAKDSKAISSVLADQFVYFTVSVKADSYPATVSVSIERLATGEQVYTYASVTETLTDQTKPDDKELIGVAMDGTAQLVKGADGYYRLGTADGDIVYVLLTEKIGTDRFREGVALAYMDKDSAMPVNYSVEEDVTGAEYKKIVNYTKFLRGFEKYKETYFPADRVTIKEIPAQMDVDEYYAKHVNADGAYPLTEGLKSFLEKFYTANKNTFDDPRNSLIPGAAEGCGWMFPLYYYVDAVEADVIVGDYRFVECTENGNSFNSNTDGDDYYLLTVDKRGSFVITQYNPRGGGYVPYYQGTWVKDAAVEGKYTFSDTMYSVEFTATFENGTITLVSSDNVYSYTFALPQDEVIGEYAFEQMGNTTTLTVKADGTFTISTGMGSTNGTWVKNADGTYTFTEVVPDWDPTLYTVTRNAATGTLTFDDGNVSDAYVFDVVVPDITGEYTYADVMANLTLTVNVDGTFTIANDRGGVWSVNNDGTYTFTEVYEEGGNVVYTVTLDKSTGNLSFVDETEYEVYNFAPKAAE